MTKTNHQLQRFIDAQADCYPEVVKELKHGKKLTHWMWFIFPQLKGLGRSEIAILYSIKSKAEARVFLNHLILGKRLIECTELVLGNKNTTAEDIFSYPDYLKFFSSMTLFDEISDGDNVFKQALLVFNDGQQDEATLDILHRFKS